MLETRRMRALVVEDEVKMAALLRRGLEEEEYAVDVATSGSDAVWFATSRMGGPPPQ
jgi:two-component system OmpR family response regulator